jgi:hypothetical protein
MPTPSFQLIGQIGSGYALDFARLNFNYGDGYMQSVLVGHADGQEFMTIEFNGLSNRTAQNLTDSEDSATKTPEKYLIDFVKRRAADGASFTVTTTRGDTLTVRLVDYRVEFVRIGKNVSKASIKVMQAR